MQRHAFTASDDVQGLALNAPALGRKLTFLDNVAMVIVGAASPLVFPQALSPFMPEALEDC